MSKSTWLINNRSLLLKRATLIDILTETEYTKAPEDSGLGGYMYAQIGSVITKHQIHQQFLMDILASTGVFTDGHWIIGAELTNDQYALRLLGELGRPVFDVYEKFEIKSGDIENFSSPVPETTTVGRYILNYFALANPFGDKIPYVNDIWDIRGVEKNIAAGIQSGSISVEQFGKYMNNMFFVGTFGELAIPGFSEKAMTTDPRIKQRKAELLEQYKDQLHDPLICAKIEDELIQMDKDYLKDDPSYGFFGSESKKFNVHRKKQFITNGVSEAFSKDKSKYSFISESLSDGWSPDSFVDLFNEIRRGSYSRGLETAAGGVQSKYLLRVFQNTKITTEDCGTKRGLTVTLTEDLSKQFIGRYALINGKLLALNKNNIKQFVGKTILIRSMMYCEQKDGYCYTCAGDLFRNLDLQAIGILALDIGSTFMKASLKAMHSSKLTHLEIDDVTQYFL